MRTPALLILVAAMLASVCIASTYEEVPIGYLPAPSVTAVLKKTLSAQGRYVILSARGAVRIYDDGEHVQAARRALEQLQQSPANVTINLSVTIGLRRVTRQSPSSEPVLGYDIPIPRNYDPPRIVNSYSGGPIVVVPAQPRNFTTTRVGPGTIVNVSPIGYATRDPQVRMTETSLEGGVTRRLIGSAILGKQAVLPVLASVNDLPGLREWALAHRAISEKEPPWSAAGTELVVTPDLTNGDLNLNVVPQIVAYGPDRRQPARRIPLGACATLISMDRAAPTTTIERLSGTDPEFYRVFFGANEAREGTLTSLSFAAAIRYLGL